VPAIGRDDTRPPPSRSRLHRLLAARSIEKTELLFCPETGPQRGGAFTGAPRNHLRKINAVIMIEYDNCGRMKRHLFLAGAVGLAITVTTSHAALARSLDETIKHYGEPPKNRKRSIFIEVIKELVPRVDLMESNIPSQRAVPLRSALMGGRKSDGTSN